MFDFSLIQLSLSTITLAVLVALALDKLIGEAERFHPLVGFGNLAKWIETSLNSGRYLKLKGLLALTLCILPISVLSYFLSAWAHSDWLAEITLSGFILYITLGWRSLLEHARAVANPLKNKDTQQAQEAVARIVSRDCEQLDETDIAVAATESVLENGADAIFAALFWFIVAGVPGVVCYRLANTLDAMWGYKNERFLYFGWAAARFDDALNYFPARLTALSYALAGNTSNALKCWFTQAKFWKSPNAGPVMAAGAGAIQVSLGGRAVYHGATHLRPLLGLRLAQGTRATATSIDAACKLVNRALLLWVFLLVMTSCLLNHETIQAFLGNQFEQIQLRFSE